MRISCIQMDMALASPDANFEKAKNLIAKAMAEKPDTILLPETWNTGFFPKENLAALSDQNGTRLKEEIGSLAAAYQVNLVAGSVANVKNGRVFNTAYVFSRDGACVAEYDKTHLFTPMHEDDSFAKGDHLSVFTLDGHRCGILICYDIRFPELTRTLTVQGLDYLFLVSQWPQVRISHLETLTRARAIENQMFVACCNSCGTAGETVYGGYSVIYDPWGEVLAKAGPYEEMITADCDESILKGIRESINVFADRRTQLYKVN